MLIIPQFKRTGNRLNGAVNWTKTKTENRLSSVGGSHEGGSEAHVERDEKTEGKRGQNGDYGENLYKFHCERERNGAVAEGEYGSRTAFLM